MSVWTNDFLEANRAITDAPADALVGAVYRHHERGVMNRVLRSNGGFTASELPDDLRGGFEAYLSQSGELPAWYDPALVRRGEELFERLGLEMLVAHITASLPECYAMRNGVNVLWQTHFLTADVVRRLYQTAQIIVDAMAVGGLARGGKGVLTAQRVRLMHAAIRHLIHQAGEQAATHAPGSMEHRFARATWDPAWGEPVNQEDLAFTNLTFSYVTLRALDTLGVEVSPEERTGYLHCWNVVGHLLGIRDELLAFSWDDAAALFQKIKQRQAGPTMAGAQLTFATGLFLAHSLSIPEALASHVQRMFTRLFVGDRTADMLGVPELGPLERMALQAVVSALQLEQQEEGAHRRYAVIARALARRLVAGLTRIPPGMDCGMFEMPPHLVVAWSLDSGLTMNLRVLSDLHVEFAPFEFPRDGADVTVLAGDIGVGTEGLEQAIAALGSAPLVYVAGNHEYYEDELASVDQALARVAGAAGPSVSVLQNDEVILSGVRFLGATLWTDFDLDGEPSRQELIDGARLMMNDYRLIRDGGALLTPERTRALCLESQRFLRESLARPFPGPTVVVTHHAPSHRSWPAFAEDRHVRAACVSDLEALMGQDRVSLWIHGHTHWCVDYEVRGTRVVSNQRGYPGQEPPGFDPGRLFALSGLEEQR